MCFQHLGHRRLRVPGEVPAAVRVRGQEGLGDRPFGEEEAEEELRVEMEGNHGKSCSAFRARDQTIRAINSLSRRGKVTQLAKKKLGGGDQKVGPELINQGKTIRPCKTCRPPLLPPSRFPPPTVSNSSSSPSRGDEGGGAACGGGGAVITGERRNDIWQLNL